MKLITAMSLTLIAGMLIGLSLYGYTCKSSIEEKPQELTYSPVPLGRALLAKGTWVVAYGERVSTLFSCLDICFTDAESQVVCGHPRPYLMFDDGPDKLWGFSITKTEGTRVFVTDMCSEVRASPMVIVFLQDSANLLQIAHIF